MRLFIAIPMSPSLKETLLSAMERLKKQGVRGRYAPLQNLHLTLAFIGEVPDAAPIIAALRKVRFRPFRLTLSGTVTFGNILCAGVSGSAALLSLAEEIRRQLDAAGISYDRKQFKPHITLIRNMAGFRGVTMPGGSMTVKSFSLMQSEVVDGRRVYTELWTGKDHV